MGKTIVEQYDEQLREISNKIHKLQDDYDSLGSTIVELVESKREILAQKSEHIVKSRIFGHDKAYAIAYSPKEIGGCGELLRVMVLSKCSANKALSGVYGKSLLYRYFDGNYKLSIEDEFMSSQTHEEYEKEMLVYRISTQRAYEELLTKLAMDDMRLDEIHSYLKSNFTSQVYYDKK